MYERRRAKKYHTNEMDKEPTQKIMHIEVLYVGMATLQCIIFKNSNVLEPIVESYRHAIQGNNML